MLSGLVDRVHIQQKTEELSFHCPVPTTQHINKFFEILASDMLYVCCLEKISLSLYIPHFMVVSVFLVNPSC